MGEHQKAIACYEQALTIAREAADRAAEGSLLGHLGNCYSDLGQITRGIDYYEQALSIAREVGDSSLEATWLGNLGTGYSDLGQTARAIDYYDQALSIARKSDNRRGELLWLTNLANGYGELGQFDHAIELVNKCLAIARQIANRLLECVNLCHMAALLVDKGDYEQAVIHAEESKKIADEIRSPLWASESVGVLSLAQLCAGNLEAARAAADAGVKYHVLQSDYHLLALLGLIALRQSDRPAATQAFTAALAQAGELLVHTPENYKTLDSKGLALCGLTLCEPTDHTSAAVQAYTAARIINKDAGVVVRVLRLFDALAVVDSMKMLGRVRAAAAGE